MVSYFKSKTAPDHNVSLPQDFIVKRPESAQLASSEQSVRMASCSRQKHIKMSTNVFS